MIGHTKVVQRLLEAGANVNYQNKVITVNDINRERIHISGNFWTPLCKKGSTAINERAYLVAYERQIICGDLSETTGFKSYAMKHERKSQYAN